MILNDIKNIYVVGAGNMGHQMHNASVGSKVGSK
jgi:3-hydroxyacyl-CoA dehydrogenase